MKKSKKAKLIIVFLLLLIIGICFRFRSDLSSIMHMFSFTISDKTIQRVTVDFNDIVQDMKSLHGINNGPKSGYVKSWLHSGEWELDMTDLYQSLNIPIVRIHDAEYPYGQDEFVDIHCIFPDMSRDVDDPTAYNFNETDEYITAIINSGAQVFFRLGESIDHSGENKYINPPEDYMKWAQICEHIVRHYNEGWADGFYYDISYWEIWNEPENSGKMWTGSMEQYYELYRTTARYIKEIYPELKIGGCAMGTISEEGILNFLESLTADGQNTPLDFFSWHTYTDNPDIYEELAFEIRRLLDENGYENTESILDEWNYVKDWEDITGTANMIHSTMGATFIASSLITLEKSPIDLAMYYDGQYALADLWCGLYNSEGEKQPGYYAFSFYNRLCQLGKRVRIDENLDHFYCCAATGEKDGILLANFNPDENVSIIIQLEINNSGKNVQITRLNEKNPSGTTSSRKLYFAPLILEMQSGETLYIELS